MTMAKGYGGGFPGGGGGMGNLMAQAQKMQRDMDKAKEEIAAMTAEAAAGGGVVSAQVDGAHKVLSVTIDPSAVDPQDVEMLQDLVVAAVNEAMRKVDELAAARMARVTGGLGLPPGF
jgi:nucleoid-associated protein EbfC